MLIRTYYIPDSSEISDPLVPYINVGEPQLLSDAAFRVNKCSVNIEMCTKCGTLSTLINTYGK